MEQNLDWDGVVEDLGPRLYKYFRARFTSEQSDDLTQETLLRLVRKAEGGFFDPQRGTLRMLGFGIAHYVAKEAKGSGPVTDDIEELRQQLPSDADLETALIAKDAASKVRGLFHRLSAAEQEVLSLWIDEELTLNEVSRITGMPEGTLKSHLFRAKKKLVHWIQKENLL